MSNPPPRPGLGAPEARLAEILRVDHAGELGAVHIYRGQRAVLNRAPGKDRIAFQLQEMEAHEAEHLAVVYFERFYVAGYCFAKRLLKGGNLYHSSAFIRFLEIA